MDVTVAESSSYTCQDIDLEIAKVRGFLDQVNRESQFSGADVLAFLGDFGIGNSLEKSAALESGTNRVEQLNSLAMQKGCGGRASTTSTAADKDLRPVAVPSADRRSSRPISEGGAADELFWAAIEDSTDPADFRRFLDAFPDSRFASLAAAELVSPRQASGGDVAMTSTALGSSDTESKVKDSSVSERDGLGFLLEGLMAYQENDYQKAMQIWMPLAINGNATAQYNVGVMYARGEGVHVDYIQAHRFLSRSAEQNYVNATEALEELEAAMVASELDGIDAQVRY